MFVGFMAFTLFCAAELYQAASGSYTRETLIQLLHSTNFLFIAGGLMALVLATCSLLLFWESDASIAARKEAQVQEATIRYDRWKEQYNAETHQAPVLHLRLKKPTYICIMPKSLYIMHSKLCI